MKKIVLFSLVFLLAFCKREAKIKLPSQDPRLVVTCFISPQNPNITAVVRTSIQKFNGNYINYNKKGTTESDITTAKVEITDGTATAVLPYDTAVASYNLDASLFPILSGKSYTLTVSTPDGKKVTGSTIVPEGNFELEHSQPAFIKNTEFEVDFSFNVLIKDQPNQVNYLAAYYNIFSVTTGTNPYIFIPYDEPYIFDSDIDIQKESYSGSVNYFNYTSDTIATIPVTLKTLNCSKEFYFFNKTSREAVYNGGNPFGEPILVYSNIEGGFGCFGAYTERTDTFLAK